MNECFNQLKVEQHPDKTFIGRIEKGFDFLGYHFSRESLRVADITVKKHVERINQLYEQQKTKKATSEEMALVLGLYVKRWWCWCRAGLNALSCASPYWLSIYNWPVAGHHHPCPANRLYWSRPKYSRLARIIRILKW